MKRAALLLVPLALAATACGRYLTAAAAVVDGVTISRADLDARVEAAIKRDPQAGGDRTQIVRQTLLQMIQDLLVEQSAKGEGFTVRTAQVDKRLADIRSQFPDEAQFQQALQGQGLTLAELRRRIRSALLVEQLQSRVRSQVAVTDQQVRADYGTGSQFEEIHVRHILFSTEGTTPAAALKEAQDALAQIKAGADFAALARKSSDDPGSKDSGGDLGFVGRGRLVPEFEKAAFALKLNEVSAPVRTSFGYHLIQLVGKRSKTFEQARDDIRKRLEDAALEEAFRRYIAERIRRARIVVNPRYGDFDAAALQIVDHEFFVRSSPEPTTEPAPGLQLPPQAPGG